MDNIHMQCKLLTPPFCCGITRTQIWVRSEEQQFIYYSCRKEDSSRQAGSAAVSRVK